jgi:hypothetical protein
VRRTAAAQTYCPLEEPFPARGRRGAGQFRGSPCARGGKLPTCPTVIQDFTLVFSKDAIMRNLFARKKISKPAKTLAQKVKRPQPDFEILEPRNGPTQTIGMMASLAFYDGYVDSGFSGW